MLKEDKNIIIDIKDVHASFWVHNHGINSLKDYILSFGLKKPFVRKHVLKGINIQIKKGECFGVLGRNGSGKSTLLRVIAGIMPIENGTVNVYGKVAPVLALGVGLEPELSGIENIKIAGVLMGLTKDEIKTSRKFVQKFSELTKDDLRMQVKRYSTGMMLRLSFSIAVSNHPEILIIDETLAVGDEGFQKKCVKRIEELKNKGCTIIVVSHNTKEINKMCERAAFVSEGKIEKIGPVEEVTQYYSNIFKDIKE